MANKLITKILAQRLKPILRRIIGPGQKTYISGRLIGEVTRTTFDLFKYAKENDLPSMLLLNDLQKLFDPV